MSLAMLYNFPVKRTAFKSFYNVDNFSIDYKLDVGDYTFIRRLRKQLILNDGHTISIQASEYNYCSPRVNESQEYKSVELGFPSFESDVLKQFAEDKDDLKHTVYPYTPMEVVIYIIIEHGGIKGWKNK